MTDIIEHRFQDHTFRFIRTPQAQEIIDEVFSDNYKVIEKGLQFVPGDIILDIGANECMFSILMGHLFPETLIIAFEPVPRTFETMTGNMLLNHCKNIEAYNAAVGKPGQETIALNVNKDGKSGGSSAYDTKNEGHEQISVIARDLDQVFTDCHIAKCKLLKMDVEGAEYDILYHSTVLPLVENVAIEIHWNSRIDYMSRRPDALATWIGNKTNLLHAVFCHMAE